MSKDEKIIVAQGLTNERLIELFESYTEEISRRERSAEYIETHEIIKNELLARLSK